MQEKQAQDCLLYTSVLLSKNEEKQPEEAKKVEERPKRLKKATYSDNPEVAYGRDFKFDSDTALCDAVSYTHLDVYKRQRLYFRS